MVTLENEGDIWQFFVGEPAFTDKTYPKDADTTSLAHVTLGTSKSQKDAAMDIIMSYQTSDGMPLVPVITPLTGLKREWLTCVGADVP